MTQMVLSFSRPDPSSPTAVAGASFSTTRRGFDQSEVRDFLRMVSAEMSRLHERVIFLERELRDSRSATPMVSSDMNEAAIADMLGEETARIIQAAREAAHKIKERSEDSASRIVKEASDEAARIREETELECARRRQDASSDAEAEVLMAKQQGREMVNEARAYRERVLADVARRREMAREQLEDLHHSRERLVHAFERARTTTDDVLRDLVQPSDLPTEFVNLAPTTGPVPVIVQVDDIERLEAVRPTSSSAPDYGPDEEESPSTTPPDRTHLTSVDTENDSALHRATPDESHEIPDIIEQSVDDDVVDEHHESVVEAVIDSTDDDAPSAPSNVVPLFAKGHDTSAPPVVDVPRREPEERKPSTDANDIFARLRLSSTQAVADDVMHRESRQQPTAPKTPVEEPADVHYPVFQGDESNECFDTRNETLIPIIGAMSRMAKRVLADEQNQVLDILRGKTLVRSIDALVGSHHEHAGRYVAALQNLLNEAALAGAKSLSDDTEDVLVTKIEAQLSAIRESVGTLLIDALRERLARSLSQASDSNSEYASLVRLVYREWKNQYIDEHMDDVALTAYGRGAAAVLRSDMRVCWKFDPEGPPCADAEDNSLGGYIRGGEEFPTGHTHAPAHPGCRCVLVSDHN